MELKYNKEISPGKDIGVLLACVGKGSGKVRHIWSLELVTEFGEPSGSCRTASMRRLVRKGRIKKTYPPTHCQIIKSGNLVATSIEKAGQFSLMITLPTSLWFLSLKAGTGQTKSFPFRFETT